MAKRNAIILGATGLIGGHLANMLGKDDAYDKVIAPVRRELEIPGVQTEVFDYNKMDELKKFLPVQDMYCCLGTTIKKAGSQEKFRQVDYEYPLAAAKLAAEAGVENFLLVTALGSDPGSFVFYNRVKGELEKEIKALSFKGTFIMQPSLLTGDRPESRAGEKIGEVVLGAVTFGPFKKYAPISGQRVAERMQELAKSGKTGLHVLESKAIQG